MNEPTRIYYKYLQGTGHKDVKQSLQNIRKIHPKIHDEFISREFTKWLQDYFVRKFTATTSLDQSLRHYLYAQVNFAEISRQLISELNS